MKAMFRVWYRNPEMVDFRARSVVVVASDVHDAIEKAERKTMPFFKKDPDLFVSDVELLGVES